MFCFFVELHVFSLEIRLLGTCATRQRSVISLLGHLTTFEVALHQKTLLLIEECFSPNGRLSLFDATTRRSPLGNNRNTSPKKLIWRKNIGATMPDKRFHGLGIQRRNVCEERINFRRFWFIQEPLHSETTISAKKRYTLIRLS